MLRLVFLFLLLFNFGSTWAQVESVLMPGEVIAGHAKLESKCKECHIPFERDAQNKLCSDCHKEVGADFLNHKGFHGRQDEKECRTCHTDHKGRNAKIVILDTAKFDHSKTDFPLQGAHQKQDKVKCKDCHEAKKKYSEAPSACNACHRKDDKHKGTLGTDCANCHVDRNWKEAKFDHSKTKFALTGKHVEVSCKKCHVDFNRYKEASSECVSCHRKDDKHKGQYGKKCEDCHNDRDWKKIDFDHDLKTHFNLLGKHISVKCLSCHKGPLYKEKTPTTCIACHRKEDVHKGGLGEKCATCHNEEKWKTTRFSHDKDTKYPLLGKHISTKCDACHKPAMKEKKEKLALTCIGCHKIDDKHKGDFGTKCESCHKEKDWKTSHFNHDKDTKYPLLGKHISTKCDACHKPGLRDKIALTCGACHKADDKHKGDFGAKCESCHKEKDWKTTHFNHDKDTKYPLLGKHISTKCDACHTPGLRDKIALTCGACHKTDDKHKGEFGAKCESCHKEKDWKTIYFSHDKDTKYPLKGKHDKVKCTACHTGKLYQQKLGVDCMSCHKKDDVHKDKLGQRCVSCHSEKDWKDTSFNHGRARFPLLGMHFKVECKKCHETKLYRDSPMECIACHKDKDDETHKRRLGKKCETCHNARSWKAWDYDHDKHTKFKLEGGHKKPDCYACHKKEVTDKFVVPRTCVGCHDEDDVHRGDLGRQCEICHVTSKFRTLKIGK